MDWWPSPHFFASKHMLPYKPINFNFNTFRGIINYIYFKALPIKLKLFLCSPNIQYSLIFSNFQFKFTHKNTNFPKKAKPWLTPIDNDNPYILSLSSFCVSACYRIGPKLRWIILVSCYSQQVRSAPNSERGIILY